MPRSNESKASELEREADEDDTLADEHREDNPTYADYLYQRAHWKRYLASNERDNREESPNHDPQ